MAVNQLLLQSMPLGMPPNDWNVVCLREVTSKIGSGATPKGGEKVYQSQGVRLIRSQNVYDHQFHAKGLVHINGNAADKLSNVVVQPNDVLLNITGDSIARCCLVPEWVLPARVNQHVAIIRPTENLNSIYLQKYLSHPKVKTYLLGHDAGGTRKALTKGHIESFLIPLPPLSKQHAIAHILGTLDDKIELNQQMNRKLDAIAQAIFKSWFVDFDPVHAKMEGRQPAGIDAATADLFPDSFEDSQMGEIPKGWTVVAVGKEVEIVKGRSYRSSELMPSSTALVTLKSVQRGGGYQPDGLKPYNGDYKPEQVITPGELIVAYTDLTQAADVIGKPAIVRPDFRYETLVASLDISIIRPKSNKIELYFLYFLFLTEDFQAHIYGHTNGSTVLHLGKDGVPSYEFVCPPKLLATQFQQIAEPLFCQIAANEQESVTLAAIRDTLLPKLMSGEIRVKDAEKLVKAAV